MLFIKLRRSIGCITSVTYGKQNILLAGDLLLKGGFSMPNKNRKVLKYRKFALTCLYISIPLNIIATLLSYSNAGKMAAILLIPGITLLISFILVSFIFWRCPSCKKRLTMKHDIKNNTDEVLCPYCSMNFLYDDVDG